VVKGCLGFAAVFVLGVATFIGGFVYEIMYAGLQYQDPTPELRAGYESAVHTARKIEVTGIAIAFGSIFAAAGWGFYRRLKLKDEEA
jgi:hypothetical protein